MSAALQSYRRTVTLAWPQGAKEAARELLIRTAKTGHARIMADAKSRVGIVPTFEAYANSPGRPVESVVLPGPIVYRYKYLTEVIRAVLDALRAASPVRSGEYARGHTIFIDGVPVAKAPTELRPGMDIMISNPVIYSRRLEIGKTKAGRSFVLQVPNRIYERVAKSLAAKYRNTAKVSFAYAQIPSSYRTRGGLSSHYIASGGVRRKRRQAAGSQVASPAIVIGVLT